MKKLLPLLLSLLCFSAIAQRQIARHEHFVIKEWEEVRQSGDTLIYTSPKILRGYNRPRKDAFYFKHPKIVKYLEEEGLLLVYNEITYSPPFTPVILKYHQENDSKIVVDFKAETTTRYIYKEDRKEEK